MVTATGVLTDAELTLGLASLTHEPSFHSDIRAFIDFHGVTESKLSGKVLMFAASNPKCSSLCRRAFLCERGFSGVC